jgi:DnaK suppressor protein
MDLTIYQQRLEQRRSELTAHSERSKNTRAPVELDQTTQGRLSRQDALMQQAMAEATERHRAIELQKIESALKRIQTGDFGYCLRCEEEIAEKRLDHDPAIALCIDCAD